MAAVSLLAAGIDLRLDNSSMRVPYGAGSDTSLTLTVIKTMVEHGWIYHSPGIGAPGGTDFYDYSVGLGETLHFVVMRLLATGVRNPVIVMNSFFIAGYPAVAVIAFLVFRRLGLNGLTSGIVAILFAVLPYHALRNEVHLTLSAYYAVPLGCLLNFGAMGLLPLFAKTHRSRSPLLRWGSRRTFGTLSICLVVATATLYYALFTVAIMMVAAPIAYVAHRERARLVQGLAVAGVIFGLTVMQQAPALAYRIHNGSNHLVGSRSAGESEFYGLKAAYMFLPRPGHRINALSKIGARYGTNSVLPSEGFSPNLGFLFAAGLLLALVSLASRGLIGDNVRGRQLSLMACCGLGAAVAVAIGTVGGGSALFAYLVSPQVRGWDRISVFVAFFAATAVAVAADGLLRRAEGRSRDLIGLGSALVGLLAFLDQTTGADAPNYAAAAAGWRNDARFVSAVERVAPADGMVLQLPYVPFPENPPVFGMADYDQFKGYIHSKNLRWSYGAMKGRPSDWMAGVDTSDVESLVPAAVAAGFDGVWVDQAGYADHGDDVTRRLARMAGIQHSVLSDDRRLVYFDLRGYAKALAARADDATERQAGHSIVRPPQVAEGGGIAKVESDGTSRWRWAQSDATLKVTNETGGPERVTITTTLQTPTPAPAAVDIVWPDGSRRSLTVSQGRRVRAHVVLPKGDSAIRLRTAGPPGPTTPADTRDRRLQVVNLSLTDDSVTRLEREAATLPPQPLP